MNMTVEKLDSENMTLKPQNLTNFENIDLMLYHINGLDLGYNDDKNNPKSGLRMKMSLKRKIMSEMMTTFLPSILLLMITFAPTFFKPVYFEAALTVNLTNMLVMTTIFTSVMDRLPTTSYLKMIDIWLIFCQLIPFSEVGGFLFLVFTFL